MDEKGGKKCAEVEGRYVMFPVSLGVEKCLLSRGANLTTLLRVFV